MDARLIDRVTSLTCSLEGGNAPAPALPAAPIADDLTPRELEVLRHLVWRATDREIADQLSISPRTVMHHVSHILAKLGVASRRDAGSLAVRYNLAVCLAVLATMIWTIADVSAQGGANRTLTILAAQCPASYVGTASADECDDAPMPGVAFRAGRPYTDFFMSAATDAAGLVAFDITGLPLRGTIRLMEETPPNTARVVVFCVDQTGTPLPITYVPMHGNVPPIMVADVSVGESGDAFCDWYNVAFN